MQSEPIRFETSAPEATLAKLEQLKRRTAKLGTAPISWQFGEPTEKEQTQIFEGREIETYSRKLTVKVYPVTLSGLAPILPGNWQFIAAVDEETSAGNTLRVSPFYSEEIPKRYREHSPTCEHCRVKRFRKKHYILKNDSGTWKEVGSTCIRDFLGHDSPEAIANQFQFFDSAWQWIAGIEDAEAERGPRDNPEAYTFKPVEVLTAAAASIRLNGWTSRAKAAAEYTIATADAVRTHLFARQECERLPLEPCDAEKAQATLDHWNAQGPQPSEYLRNVQTLCKADAVTLKSFGVICSAIAAAANDRQSQRKIEADTSKHVGTIGTRQEFTGTVEKILELPGNQFQEVRHQTAIRDEAGNLLIYWNLIRANGTHAEEGDDVTFSAGVKDHGNFRGVAQTVLTRATKAQIFETA